MRASSFFPLLGVAFVISLLVSMFILPIGYTYDETCPTCHGEGTVTCETCHGSGICWICGGDGTIGSQWCAACQGSGRCYTCGGAGWHECKTCAGTGTLVHWMYSSAGSTLVLSVIESFLFLGFFSFSYVVSAFYLSFNEWVYDVEDMGFWFNPSFMMWLFAKHPKRWVKRQTVLILAAAILNGSLLFFILSLGRITQTSLLLGLLFSIPLVVAFSLAFYESYVSRINARV